MQFSVTGKETKMNTRIQCPLFIADEQMCKKKVLLLVLRYLLLLYLSGTLKNYGEIARQKQIYVIYRAGPIVYIYRI